MALIVQKYGGSSVKDTDRIKNVANRVAEYRRQGDQIVVVVSAMGGVTDNLIRLASEINQLPSEREMDMLLAIRRANDHCAAGHGTAFTRSQGGELNRRAGGYHDRWRAYQSEDRKHFAQSGTCDA